ncbi:hypothetical protein EBB05_01215 [Methylobacterium brachiatum]|nr:hypothetical protein EBB05_01215 [Methylobacterium brachiatum]
MGRTLLTRPQKAKVLGHLAQLKGYLDANKQAPVAKVIADLGPKVRGWSYYYRHCAATETFRYASHRAWAMLWAWATRRHPNKPSKWVKARYFRDDGYWTLIHGAAQLYRHNATPITRFTKVIGRSSPMNPAQREYWEQRKQRSMAREAYRKSRLAMLRAQANACGLCHVAFWPGDPIDDHHIVRKHEGGSNDLVNRMLAHRLVPPRASSADMIPSRRGLSRVRGNSHARFLGGGGAAMRPRYPAGVGHPCKRRR